LPIEDESPGEFTIDDDVIREVIHRYTNEAGLRKIKEILQDTFREVNLNMIYAGNNPLGDGSDKNAVTLQFIEDKVLHGRHRMNISLVDNNPTPTHTRVYGMFATGSGVGGVLPIRINEDYGAKDPSSFPVRVTGSLGDVMKESVEIARTVCLWLHRSLGLDLPAKGVHIHFPEGATPKDGPSAGSAICLALFAFSRGLSVPGDITITGEIDIDGAVLQVGGIPEKLTGAKRAGASRSIIPDNNQRDLRILRDRIPDTELPDEITPVKHIYDVFHIVFGDDWRRVVTEH
jgi:ATP-dependent Lon protease